MSSNEPPLKYRLCVPSFILCLMLEHHQSRRDLNSMKRWIDQIIWKELKHCSRFGYFYMKFFVWVTRLALGGVVGCPNFCHMKLSNILIQQYKDFSMNFENNGTLQYFWNIEGNFLWLHVWWSIKSKSKQP